MSRNTSHASSCKTACGPVARIVIVVTVSNVGGEDVRARLLLRARQRILDIFGIEGEVGGICHELFSVALAHVRSHTNDQSDQASQPNETKNKP